MHKATVGSSYLQVLLSGAKKLGIKATELAHSFGLQLDALDDPEGRIPLDVHYQLWEEVARRSGDDAFGLHLAESLEPGAFAIIDYVARNSPTVGEAYGRVVRYSRLVHDGAEVKLELDGDTARIAFGLPAVPEGSPRHAAEFITGCLIVIGRQMSGVDFSPAEVAFAHHTPKSIDEHRRLFRCPVLFEQPLNWMSLDRAVLATPTRDADPRLRGLLDRYAEELLTKLPQADDLMGAVRRIVAEGLQQGDPTLETVAKKLAMSPRTLQRRLKEDGTSHQEVLDALRRELAEKYLREPSIGIGEAAFLLGFSEPSAFHRAFKRWTGTTPGAYRRKQMMH